MRRTCLLLLPCLAVVAAGALTPAQAGPPKSFSRTVTFVDATPDPTAYLLGPEHCQGRLPAEAPVAVEVPASGVLDIAISGFQGEWSLMVTNDKGTVLGTADADPPATESMKLKVKRAGKVNLLPCNIAGTTSATLTYTYTYKR